MAETLKSRFGLPVVTTLAKSLAAAWPPFDAAAFVREASSGFDELELMGRAAHLAEVMQRHLPADFASAGKILLASLGPDPSAGDDDDRKTQFFFYLPHVLFVGRYGLQHFELSMRLQHALTQRFTAEFSIRRFLEHDPAKTLDRLALWATDPSEHVRRLVSEGTRPRLPWAPRLREFQRDPEPVLRLLELLKDDPSLYVRRSVANNLNDIGKDNPQLLMATARRWLVDASPQRRWIVEHGLRSAVKRAEPAALELLGYGHAARLAVDKVSISPQVVVVGDTLTIGCELHNPLRRPQEALVDLRLHYVKANGSSSPKVFKLKRLQIGPGESVRLVKRLSMAQKTTRRHHAGEHRVDLLINGKAHPLGSFDLRL